MRREGDGRGGKEIEEEKRKYYLFFLYRLWWQFVYAKTLSV